MTESEWQACESPYDMLEHLEGKIDDQAFMQFSVACCRRIWPLITDPRSRAVVDAAEQYLAGTLSATAAGRICAEWDEAYRSDQSIDDLAGGVTNQAIESVYGLGEGHALQVSAACFEAAGYAASEPIRSAGASQSDVTNAWKAAERAEQLAQCDLLRQIFGCRR
jgi:hypothetical protein